MIAQNITYVTGMVYRSSFMGRINEEEMSEELFNRAKSLHGANWTLGTDAITGRQMIAHDPVPGINTGETYSIILPEPAPADELPICQRCDETANLCQCDQYAPTDAYPVISGGSQDCDESPVDTPRKRSSGRLTLAVVQSAAAEIGNEYRKTVTVSRCHVDGTPASNGSMYAIYTDGACECIRRNLARVLESLRSLVQTWQAEQAKAAEIIATEPISDYQAPAGSAAKVTANRATSQKRDNQRAARNAAEEAYRANADTQADQIADHLQDLGFVYVSHKEIDGVAVTIWQNDAATVKQTPYTIRIYNGHPKRCGRHADAALINRMEHGWCQSGESTGYAAGIAAALLPLIETPDPPMEAQDAVYGEPSPSMDGPWQHFPPISGGSQENDELECPDCTIHETADRGGVVTMCATHQAQFDARKAMRRLIQDFEPTINPEAFDACAIGDLIDLALFVAERHSVPAISGGSHDLTECPDCGEHVAYGLPCDCQHDALTDARAVRDDYHHAYPGAGQTSLTDSRVAYVTDELSKIAMPAAAVSDHFGPDDRVLPVATLHDVRYVATLAVEAVNRYDARPRGSSHEC